MEHLNVVPSVNHTFQVHLYHWGLFVKELAYDLLRQVGSQGSADNDQAIGLFNVVHHGILSVEVLGVAFVEEHAVRLHHGSTLLAFGHKTEVCFSAILEGDCLFWCL